MVAILRAVRNERDYVPRSHSEWAVPTTSPWRTAQRYQNRVDHLRQPARVATYLQDALDQAQAGKGRRRHANGKPFVEQPIITDGRACGLAGPAFQARKKILE